MRSKNENMNCRVCGLTQDAPPWGSDGKTPLFEVCDCCNVEFGYEDGSIESVRRFRHQWLSNGGDWTGKNRPENWNRDEQFEGIPFEFQPDETDCESE